MRYKIYISIILILSSATLFSQRPDTQHIRVVDTLTAKERAGRNPVILKAELDSLIMAYHSTQAQVLDKGPVKEKDNSSSQYLLAGLVVIIILLGCMIYLFYSQRKKINKMIIDFNEKTKHIAAENGQYPAGKEKKGKISHQTLESKIAGLNEELYRLSRENESLNRVIKEYNGIQHEFDSLKHGILKTYKVKNYPGYDKSRNEILALQGVLDTENVVANYAYEKFLKPILALTDANKNSPARLNNADKEKLLDLVISLSLLYIEYLYLRVNDLSVGGKMVERIKGFVSNNGIDNTLLKKLNTEFGSRALVMKMALSQAGMQHLSYPVFDETNLNNQ